MTVRRDYGSGSIERRANGRWRVTVELPRHARTGRRRRRRFSVAGTKRDAQRALRQALGERDHGGVDPSRITIAEWLELWLDRRAADQAIGPRVAENYRTIVRLHLAPKIGNQRLQDLRLNHVNRSEGRPVGLTGAGDGQEDTGSASPGPGGRRRVLPSISSPDYVESRAMYDRVDLRRNLLGWSRIAENHRSALGDGWVVAESFVDLHTSAVQRLGQSTDLSGARHEAAIKLGTHSLNLYVGALALLIRGQFDISAYLMRALFDMPCMILATAHDEAQATRFLGSGAELRASEARKWVESYHDDAERFLYEGDELRGYMNEYSHAGQYHARALLDVRANGITPTFGGRPDEQKVLRDVAIVSKFEMVTLDALSDLNCDLDDAWTSEYFRAARLYTDWSNDVRETSAS